ncbi:MAG TPA: hypothetical protein VFE61_30525 [Candidatus Sulfotelmatobacter sp.]|nr:hypothetical protein [Candidatus Sulfotelmatobacter sp.]
MRGIILTAVGKVPGVLSDPEPEALITDITPDAIKLRILWSTHDARQHQMLASYDQVLTSIVAAIDQVEQDSKKRRAA